MLLVSILPVAHASVPCGVSGAGVLNVGILPQNLPWSDIVAGQAVGFDPLLISQVAKLLGYSTVNFIGYASNADALVALGNGEIDIYANSNDPLVVPPVDTIGIVTDISQLENTGGPEVLGWQVNLGCCAFAQQLDAAITKLVQIGVYAQILQAVRLAGLTNGYTLGFPGTVTGVTGVLLEPFPFASNELGAIPAICSPVGPNFLVTLPQTNCIGAYLQANCSPGVTFTGATGQLIP